MIKTRKGGVLSPKRRIMGLIPAAGEGRRLSRLPMSKELYPVGFQSENGVPVQPKVAAQYLLDRMSAAEVGEAYLIIHPEKWDIPRYFGDGCAAGVALAYLTVHTRLGVPFTLNQAFPFVQDAIIALGFPDILFWPENAYEVLLHRLANCQAQVVLGLFPTDQPSQVGVVDVDSRGRVHGLYEKSELTHLGLMWAVAVWKPPFTAFLHEFVESQFEVIRKTQDAGKQGNQSSYPELPMGDVIHAAIRSGMQVEAETFHKGAYIDIGTPSNLLEAIRHELPIPMPRRPKGT